MKYYNINDLISTGGIVKDIYIAPRGYGKNYRKYIRNIKQNKKGRR